MPFTHHCFQTYEMEAIPLNRDLYLMDVAWMPEWEAATIAHDEGKRDADADTIGFVSYIAARAVHESGVELVWFCDVFQRWHEVKIFLPRDAFVAAVLAWNYDKRPTIFVKSEWVEQLYLRTNSIFAMIDAAGMTQALRAGHIDRQQLLELRDRIDAVAARHLDMSFISFADSLLIKTNWVAGYFTKGVMNTYKPEALLEVFQELRVVFKTTLNLGIYCVIAQGSNEYYDDPLLHRSNTGNHISLNSLGLPFAHITAIEATARAAIRNGWHGPSELYMDADFFRSLRLDKRESYPSNSYEAKMTTVPGLYFYADCDNIMRRLKPLAQ